MADPVSYVFDGMEITPKPPRARWRGRQHDQVAPEGSAASSASSQRDSLELQELEASRYEFCYLDHPADVFIVGTGKTLGRALESIAIGMYSYMTDLSLVKPLKRETVVVEGRSLPHLLFHFLNECLYLYSGSYFMAKHVRLAEEIDLESLARGSGPLKATFWLYGDQFDSNVHTSGTEIKAITYHGMKIEITAGGNSYVISDDGGSDASAVLSSILSSGGDGLSSITGFRLFTLVDI